MNKARMRRRTVITTTEPTGVAGNAPDLKAQEPVRLMQIGAYTGLLARNPPSLLARHGQRSSIRFLWALALFDGDGFRSDPDSPVRVITLEKTTGRDPMLCAFDDRGGHQTYGAEWELLNDEDGFVERAVELVRAEVVTDFEAGTRPHRGMEPG